MTGKELEKIYNEAYRAVTEEEAIALASSEGNTVDRQAARDAVASAFREEIRHAFEPGAKVMSADRELRYQIASSCFLLHISLPPF